MRRALAVMLSVLTFLPISGCTLSVYNNYRGLERLQVIETVGLDSAEDGGVTLSISAGRDASGREPVRASASAQSVTEAMQELQDRSRSDELFFSGTGCILLGEAAAAETARWLELIARSDSLRLDTPLFVVRSGEASELVTEAGGEESDITQIMNALMHYAEKSGPARIYTCLDAARSLIENGAALTGAVREGEDASKDGSLTAELDGYAILGGEGRLMGYIEGEDALGVGLFIGEPGRAALTLSGGITAELAGGSVELDPVWDEAGSISALELRVSVDAIVLETAPGADLSSEEARSAVEDELAQRAGAWIYNILSKSVSLGLDFLGLGQRLERENPERWHAMTEPWSGMLPELELTVRAGAKLLNVREFAGAPDWSGTNGQ